MGKGGGIAGLALAAFVFAGAVQAAPCSQTHVDIRAASGQVRFAVEIADDREEQSRGLMHRDTLATFDGMLFVYEAPAKAAFWMKNTLIPLDMVFIDHRGMVTHVHANAVPGDLTPIRSRGVVKAVLEIGGGLAEKFGIVPGSEVRHPVFSDDLAVWGCQG